MANRLEAQALFQAAKAIPAAQVARDAGLRLVRRGAREWTCCPFHGEKTPSLMFDERGQWHCFGCGKGGDAAAFYAGLHHVSQADAARALLGDATPEIKRRAQAAAKGQELKRRVGERLLAKRRAAQDALDMAQAALDILRQMEEEKHTDRLAAFDACWDSPAFRAALEQRNKVRDWLLPLDDMTREEQLDDCWRTDG